VFFVFASLFRRAANYVFILMLSRALEIDDFGEFSALLNRYSYFLIFANLGYNDIALVKSKNIQEFNSLLSNGLLLSLFYVFVIISFIYTFSSGASIVVLLVIIKVFFENAFYTIILARFQFVDRLKKVSVLNLVYGILVIAVSLIASEYYPTLEGFLLPIAISCLIMSIAYLWGFRWKFGLNNFRKFFQIRDFKYYTFSFVCAPIYMQMPSFFASYFFTKEEMAIYQIAYTMSNVVLLVSLSYIQSKLGTFLKNKNNLRQLIRRTIQITLVINISFIFSFYLFGDLILDMIYPTKLYNDSVLYVCFLSAINLLIVIASSFSAGLVVNERQKEKLSIQIKTIVVGFLIIPLAVYSFALDGLVLSALFTFMVSLVLYFKSVRTHQII